MTGIKDQNGREIQIGDVVEFGGDDFNVVYLDGEDGLNGYFLERHFDDVDDGEHYINRVFLIAANPASMKVVT